MYTASRTRTAWFLRLQSMLRFPKTFLAPRSAMVVKSLPTPPPFSRPIAPPHWALVRTGVSRRGDSSVAAKAAWRDDCLEFAQVQIADRSQSLCGRAVLKAVRQVFQPSHVFNLRLHEAGDMVGPATCPAAVIGRPVHTHDRHASCPRRTVTRLAFSVGHGCFTTRFGVHGSTPKRYVTIREAGQDTLTA